LPVRDAARHDRVGGDRAVGWNVLVDLDAQARARPRSSARRPSEHPALYGDGQPANGSCRPSNACAPPRLARS
jgi:hypothetical protein